MAIDDSMFEPSRASRFCDVSSADIAAYTGSLAAFVSAQISYSRAMGKNLAPALSALKEAAADVRIDCVTGETIAVLGTRIRESTRASMIYEQYCSDLLYDTRRAMRALTPLLAEALAVHMELDVLIADSQFVHEAVQEAYDALYGEAEDWS